MAKQQNVSWENIKVRDITIEVIFDNGPRPTFSELRKQGRPLAWIPDGFKKVDEAVHQQGLDTKVTYFLKPK